MSQRDLVNYDRLDAALDVQAATIAAQAQTLAAQAQVIASQSQTLADIPNIYSRKLASLRTAKTTNPLALTANVINVINMNVLTIDTGGVYDLANSIFTFPENSIWLFMMKARLDAATPNGVEFGICPDAEGSTATLGDTADFVWGTVNGTRTTVQNARIVQRNAGIRWRPFILAKSDCTLVSGSMSAMRIS